MIEHPVPQNITSYEFRLIGNMTIKQFLLLLAGGGLGFLAYSTNLPGFLKWPLVIIGVVSGIAMAFLPYEERSMDQWFVNFVKAIYRPTKYYWRRVPKPPAFFTYQAIPSAMADAQKIDMTPYRQTQVKQFLSSLSPGEEAPVADPLDMLGKSSGMDLLFSQTPAAPSVTSSGREMVSKPSLQTRPRPLGAVKTSTVYTAPAAATTLPAVPVEAPAKQSAVPPETTTIAAVAPTTLVEKKLASAPMVITPQSSALTVESATDKKAEKTETKSGAEVQELQTVSVGRTAQSEPPAPVAVASTEPVGAYIAPGNAPRTAHMESVIPAVFDKTLPFPSTADKPNILIGMVHNATRGILAGAIVEIVDADGNTVRAMKTNSLGQFYMSSPLKDGTYSIHTEKEGSSFPVYELKATGAVLDPVDITASA